MNYEISQLRKTMKQDVAHLTLIKGRRRHLVCVDIFFRTVHPNV